MMTEDTVPYESIPTVHPWLAGFRPADRPMVCAWFSYAVSQGARRPLVIIQIVERVVSAKRDWSVSPTSLTCCEVTLAALALRRSEALAYAAACLATA